jgi:hypothetical protein
MTRHSNFSLRAARDTAARVNGTTLHNASHPAPQLKTAAVSRGQTLVRAAGSVSSVMTDSSAADVATDARGNTTILTNASLAVLLKTACGKAN